MSTAMTLTFTFDFVGQPNRIGGINFGSHEMTVLGSKSEIILCFREDDGGKTFVYYKSHHYLCIFSNNHSFGDFYLFLFVCLTMYSVFMQGLPTAPLLDEIVAPVKVPVMGKSSTTKCYESIKIRFIV